MASRANPMSGQSLHTSGSHRMRRTRIKSSLTEANLHLPPMESIRPHIAGRHRTMDHLMVDRLHTIVTHLPMASHPHMPDHLLTANLPMENHLPTANLPLTTSLHPMTPTALNPMAPAMAVHLIKKNRTRGPLPMAAIHLTMEANRPIMARLRLPQALTSPNPRPAFRTLLTPEV